MGCDIHCFVEKKVDGVWQSVGEEEDLWRDYALFGALASVRREYPGVSKEPLGLPTDASAEVRADHKIWDCDAHSASHMTLEELELLTLASSLSDFALAAGVPQSLKDFIEAIFPDGAERNSYRAVFWFDN